MARFVHADSWLEPLRDRWEVHVKSRIDAVLAEANSHLQITSGASGSALVGKLREEIHSRAAKEPGVGFFVRGERRKGLRPWSTRQARLDRLASYAEFISCPWCVPFWVFAVAVAWTWGRVYGFAGDVFAPVAIPVDYALIALALGLRWVYGTLVVALGQDH